MESLKNLLNNNRHWAEQTEKEHPGFFEKLAAEQKPKYMWIGCADSRIPPNIITGLGPGEVFVHRNIANLVIHADLSLLSTLEFAVKHLRIKHIIVAGHYGCAGVQAALEGKHVGVTNNWLKHIETVRDQHYKLLNFLPDDRQAERLCALNVIEQTINLAKTTIIQDVWRYGQSTEAPNLYGLIYNLHNGLLEDLQIHLTYRSYSNLEVPRDKAIKALRAR